MVPWTTTQNQKPIAEIEQRLSAWLGEEIRRRVEIEVKWPFLDFNTAHSKISKMGYPPRIQNLEENINHAPFPS